MDPQDLLTRTGLDSQETAVYLGVIALDEATAGQIAQQSGVPRTYTYKILDALAEKGLVQASPGSGVRRYSITDYEAPKRYLERRQMELYQAQQDVQSLSIQLENLSKPQVPTALAEPLKNQQGLDDFWRLLHSTLTREIWVIHAPEWWTDESHSRQVKKWQQYRAKQHIWERRFVSPGTIFEPAAHTETKELFAELPADSSIFLIDQYQVQVTNWEPFRAIRIASQEMVDVMKGMVQ